MAAQVAVELGLDAGTNPAAALGLGLLHGVQREAVLAARAIFVDFWPETGKLARAHARLAD